MAIDTALEVSTLRRLHHLMGQVSARHDLQELLQNVADGVVEVVGFQVAAISYLRSTGSLEVVAVAGDDTARAQLLGVRIPVEDVLAEFALADKWGLLRFIPAGRSHGDIRATWTSDVEPLDVPDAWNPEDLLIAPLTGPSGELAGLLSVDLPHDGLRPGQFQREVLEMYAVQASIAINNAQQRSHLAEQVRLATSIRSILDTAARDLDLGRIIDDCVEPVVSGLRCHGMWIRAFAGEGERPGRGRGAIYPSVDPLVPSDEILALGRRVSAECWTGQRALIMSETIVPPADLVSTDEVDMVLRFVGQTGGRTVLLVPMGAGAECLGYLALTRNEEGPSWSDDEVSAALEIGRELGRAVLHARLFEREREIVGELRDLDRCKTELIATISHELKSPLTAIIGHLELIEVAETGSGSELSLVAIDRNVGRLRTLVDDLLLLSKVGDPNRLLVAMPVDMAAVLREAVEMFGLHAERRGVAVKVADIDAPAVAWGDPAELDRVVVNIVGNAIKFTPAGRSVYLSLEATGQQVTFVCRDDGLGISHADQERLFTEFYRSTNPAAQAIPGCGLGLTIVKRILDRHRGTISVVSDIGTGSTFTITVPTPPTDSPAAGPAGS